jgi:hypothetical protein
MPENRFERQAAVCRMDETDRQALGHFLRERRESVKPEDVGISSSRGRRTPGLRREEVAFLADIGVKWYARLEAGDQIRPSPTTLTGIAVALRLTNTELEYMLELAGVRQPVAAVAEVDLTIPEPLAALVDSLRGVGATVTDRILTPLRWNALADRIYGHSRRRLPVDRNALVRALLDEEFAALLGADREKIVFKAVGVFRLNYSSDRPSPLLAAVYEKVKHEPLFLKAWNQRVVSHDLTEPAVMMRNHPLVGTLAMYTADLSTWTSPDLFVRTVIPAGSESAAKFERLSDLAQSHETIVSKAPAYA